MSQKFSSFFLLSLPSARRVLGMAGIAVSVFFFHSFASFAQEETIPSLTPEVGKVLEAAQTALENKNAAAALDDVMKASRMPNTNSFDNYMIQRMRAAACTQKEEMQCAISAYESLLGSPHALPDEKKRMLSAIAVLAYHGHEYERCEKASLEYLEKHGYDSIMATLLVQCPYVAEKWDETVKAGNKLHELAEKAQKPVSESNWQMLAIAYGKLDQSIKEREIYTILAEQYSKPRYWEFLLHDFMADPRLPQRLRFNVMRLRLATGVRPDPKEFQEMAERAVQMDVPSLALKLLQTGYQKNILGAGDAQELEEQAHFKKFIEQQVAKAHRHINEAIVQARKASSAGALLATGYELVLEGHAAAGLALMREGMENHPNYPDIAELEYAMAELDAGRKGAAIRHFQTISGNGPAHGLGGLWARQLQSQGGN